MDELSKLIDCMGVGSTYGGELTQNASLVDTLLNQFGITQASNSKNIKNISEQKDEMTKLIEQLGVINLND